jgi:hypothetical protein
MGGGGGGGDDEAGGGGSGGRGYRGLIIRSPDWKRVRWRYRLTALSKTCVVIASLYRKEYASKRTF